MITDDKEIVSAIRARLADRVGNDRYEMWFSAPTRLAVRGGKLIVSVPSQFLQDWLRTHFRKELEAASRAVVGEPLSVEFRLAPAASNGPDANGPDANGAAANGAPHEQPAAIGPAARAAAPAAAKPATAPRTMLARPLATLDNFVVGPSNCLPHTAAQMAVEQPGSYAPLFIYGSTGTGKTHLLEGIYEGFRRTHPGAPAVLLSAEQFTGLFVQAVHKSGMASFRAKYRGLQLLVIEDVQFLARKHATIGELQHTVDGLLRAGRQLVFSADRSPAALKALGPELVSRLQGGMVCRLDAPEYATRLGIVRAHAARLRIEVPDNVAAYMAGQITSQARELIGALKRLHATSLAHNRPISLAMAEAALAELIDHQGKVVHLADIERAVCDVFGLLPESLHSGRKGKCVAHPRMLAMYLARKYTRVPLSEIGSYFGRRSHSTVISAQRKVEGWMTQSASVKLADSSLTLEETMRRVEDRLRADCG